jgi:hypothetical protein
MGLDSTTVTLTGRDAILVALLWPTQARLQKHSDPAKVSLELTCPSRFEWVENVWGYRVDDLDGGSWRPVAEAAKSAITDALEPGSMALALAIVAPQLGEWRS